MSDMPEENHSKGKVPMDGFLDRVFLCEGKLADTTLPLARRLHEAMKVWGGLEVGRLPAKLEKNINRRFRAMNRVMRRYPIKTVEDYDLISTEDLNALAAELRKMLG